MPDRQKCLSLLAEETCSAGPVHPSIRSATLFWKRKYRTRIPLIIIHDGMDDFVPQRHNVNTLLLFLQKYVLQKVEPFFISFVWFECVLCLGWEMKECLNKIQCNPNLLHQALYSSSLKGLKFWRIMVYSLACFLPRIPRWAWCRLLDLKRK